MWGLTALDVSVYTVGMKAFDDLLEFRERCAYRTGNGYGSNPKCKRWALTNSRYCRQHDLKVLIEKARRTPLPVVER